MPPKVSIKVLGGKKVNGNKIIRKKNVSKKPTNTLTKNVIDSIQSKNQEIIYNLPELELDYLIYNVLNRDRMEKLSVVNVNTTKISENNLSTPKDFRFGTLENNVLCGCCKKTNKECIGHMGHIDLERSDFKIINPKFTNTSSDT